MPEPDVEASKAPHSLTPIQLENARDDEDLANFRSGKGLRLGAVLAVLVAAAIGVAQLLRSADVRRSYADAASQLDRSDIEQQEAFLRCALPNVARTQLTSPTALRNTIEIVSGRMEKAYGRVLATCTPLFVGFEQSVKNVKAPADVKPSVDAVSNAVSDLGRAWASYKDYLQAPSTAYDVTQAAPLIERITASWQGYETARESAKKALSAKL